MRHILVADDHDVTRRGLRELLREAFPAVEILEASDGPATKALLTTRPWNLILLDVMMPGSDLLEMLAHIRGMFPAVPVLVLTAAAEIEFVIRAMKAGANGLIHKHRACDQLIGAIKTVEHGGTYLHAETAAEIATTVRDSGRLPLHEELSERELDVFRRIATGNSIKAIAADLHLSDKTIATYLARIREKTGLVTPVEIARYALKAGLVD